MPGTRGRVIYMILGLGYWHGKNQLLQYIFLPAFMRLTKLSLWPSHCLQFSIYLSASKRIRGGYSKKQDKWFLSITLGAWLFLISIPTLCTCILFSVHFRMRPVNQQNPKTLFPSTSAITYWQFELEDRSLESKYSWKFWRLACRIIQIY